MGACCSRDKKLEASTIEDAPDGDDRNAAKNEEDDCKKNNDKQNVDDNEKHVSGYEKHVNDDEKHVNDDEKHVNDDEKQVNDGKPVKLDGPSSYISMFSQQGGKGINQDAMTVWENKNGGEGSYFCAVLDGHGPGGHIVAEKVSEMLPLKLFSSFIYSQIKGSNDLKDGDESKDNENDLFFSLWKTNLINSFEEVDQDLNTDGSFDTYSSGCATVAVLKQDNNLVIANLGDSRAVMGRRGQRKENSSLQLTVDLKPNLPSETERIHECEGRVFALDCEPEIFRLWMPHENCPGLAMARAFGDFCLKDYGLVSTPEVYYRKLTENDEFVVLATDGIWDVLSNKEVVKIVSSSKRRSTAARSVVHYAVRAWKLKYPTSRIDDCTVICLFLKSQETLLTKSISETSHYRKIYSRDGNYSLRTNSEIEKTVSCNGKLFPRSSSSRLSG